MNNQLTLADKLHKFFMPHSFSSKQRLKEHIEKFPCSECRPCLFNTFYHDIKFNCASCGRVYYE